MVMRDILLPQLQKCIMTQLSHSSQVIGMGVVDCTIGKGETKESKTMV